MALPSTGPITAQMIMQQYGGGSPFRISEYYRGGSRVPNTGANAAVPTAGAITLGNFRGQGGSGGGSLAASNSGAVGSVFQNEPAPPTRSVSASGNVFASGGTGSYTCSWSHISGSTAIPTPGVNVFAPSFTATVTKGVPLTAVKRCTVNDGVNSTSTDMSIELQYNTNL